MKRTAFSLFALLALAPIAHAQVHPGWKPLAPKPDTQVKPGEAQGFIPQPETPGKVNPLLRPGEAQGFNPQPEPPGKSMK